MKVRELLQQLMGQDPEREVVMSSDSEGNSYSPLSSISTASYVPDSTWSGEVHLEELDDELRKQGYSEEDVRKPGEDGAVAALVLVPTN